jgi:hypothetical protein
MSRNGTRLGAIALTTAAMVGGAGAAAWGASPPAGSPSLSTLQAKAAAAISLRVNDLNSAIAKVNGTESLGPDAPTLAAYLQPDSAPLQALGQKIAADTTVATAEADATTIFTNYRVLALVLPAARLAAAADGIDRTTIPGLTTLAGKAQSRENTSNQAALQPLISDLNAQIGAATSGTSGVAASVLAFTPSQWNADHSLLASARSSVQSAVGDVAKARSDVKQIRTLLESSKAAAATTTTTT